MTYRLAMLIDPPDTLNPKRDSSLKLLEDAQARGYDWCVFTKKDLFLQNGVVFAEVQHGRLDRQQSPYVLTTQRSILALHEMDVVLLRLDPPFDLEYLYVTQLLDRVAQHGTLVLNRPDSVRHYNEKIFASHFPEFQPPTLISANIHHLTAFIEREGRVVLKPIDSMAGRGLVTVCKDDLDKVALLELMTANQHKTILAQRFLPEVREGDKRILLIDGEPIEQALLRIPRPSEFRANLDAGATTTAVALTERDLEICAAIKPKLQAAGLFWVGIDVIHGYLTEINVTCPGGAVLLSEHSGLAIFDTLFDALERRLEQR